MPKSGRDPGRIDRRCPCAPLPKSSLAIRRAGIGLFIADDDICGGRYGRYLGYLDRTRWEPARYQRESTAAKARIDRDPVDITGVLRRKFGVDRVGPPDNQEYIDYKLFELTLRRLGKAQLRSRRGTVSF